MMKKVWRDYEVAAMRRALALAARGRGAVEPNPMVGAVAVRNGRVIAEGYHHRFGGPHAEVFALRGAGRRARGAEVFVTLEPCSHFGKTPPCADALIAAGVARVVVAMADPFAGVRGKGIARLRRAGIACEVGLLAAEARALNAPFIKLHTEGRPYVIAKYAMTADGNIACASGDSRWISNDRSRALVHRLRGRVDAVLVGSGTAAADDPLLTARPRGKRVALRVVIDSQARLPLSSRLVATARAVPLLVAVTSAAPASRVKALRSRGAEVVEFSRMEGCALLDARALLAELAVRGATNVLVEGGSRVLGSMFAARLVDEAYIFVAPRLIGSGLPPLCGWAAKDMSEAIALAGVEVRKIGSDVLIHGGVVYAASGPDGR